MVMVRTKKEDDLKFLACKVGLGQLVVYTRPWRYHVEVPIPVTGFK